MPDLLWVGTDDGRLHVTRDGGRTWTSVEDNVPDLARGAWVPHIHPSSHDAACAFVVFDDHRRANWTPYVYETRDYGETWKSLATPDVDGYCLSIVQDPVQPRLLFLGTEFGLFVSFDRGRSWRKWTHGVPTVGVRDLAIHPRDHDLVVATHGRSLFIIDDIRPLRHHAAEDEPELLYVLAPLPARTWRMGRPRSSRFPGQGEFRGVNRPYGAIVTVWAGDESLPRHGDEADEEAPKLVATVARGDDVIRRLEQPARFGFNRIVWDLRSRGARSPGSKPDPSADVVGDLVLPGEYRLTVRLGERERSVPVTVLEDAREAVSLDDRRANHELLLAIHELQESLTRAVDRVRDVRADIAAAVDRAPEEVQDDLATKAREARDALDAAEKLLWQPPGEKGIRRSGNVQTLLGRARRGLTSHFGRPTEAQARRVEHARRRLRTALDRLNAVLETEVAAMRDAAREAGIVLFPPRQFEKL